MLIRALLVLGPRELRRRVGTLLQMETVTFESLERVEDIWEKLRGEEADLLILGLDQLPRPPEEWIASLRQLPEPPEILLISEEEDPHRRAALLAGGAYAVLNADLGEEELAAAFRTLLRRVREDVTGRLKAARLERPVSLGDFASGSQVMSQVIATARRVARSNATILLLGETGVGKERLARAIHRESTRSAGPFIPLNCGALPEGILESELFGHEKGAFTGAIRSRRGYFELADGGTLFLDEIGELPHQLQVKLLRALEDRTFQRLGGEKTVRVDVRIMAATNRELEEEIRNNRFRADLFYRLAVVSLTIPPLRIRREDIPLLISGFLRDLRQKFGSTVQGIAPEAMGALISYPWPGNIRELMNVLERAVLLAPGPEITGADLPEGIEGTPPLLPPAAQWNMGLREARQEVVAAFERDYLRELLRKTQGRIGAAARQAGINERTLYDLLRQYGIRKESFKK